MKKINKNDFEEYPYCRVDYTKKMSSLLDDFNNFIAKYYDSDDTLSEYIKEMIQEPEDTTKKIKSLEELYDILDNEDIKEISHSKEWMDITLKDETKQEYHLDFDISKTGMKKILKAYLGRKHGYLISTEAYISHIVNLNNYTYEEFRKYGNMNPFSFSDDRKRIFFNNNLCGFELNSKTIEMLFEIFPDSKKDYLLAVKKHVKKAQEIIDSVENHQCYKMTDEDKLILEVLDE